MTGTRAMFMYQLIIEEQNINTTELEFRRKPCNCNDDFVTCVNNLDCSTFLSEPQLSDFHWIRKSL